MNPSSLSLTCSSSSKRKRDPDSFDHEPRYDKRATNDVFLNYLFEDTGKSFVSHLKGALKRNGFSISDHTMLSKGQDVCSELVKAIKESEIYLVVFSNNYAFSIKCLDELVIVMDSFHTLKKRKVFPIFFNVDPSHVRSQQGGSFMEAFQAHETNFDREIVQIWRLALNGAAQLSGLIIQNGDEEKFLRRIVKLLGKMKNPLELFDATHPVGIESRVEDIISKLRLHDNAFTIVAVLGIGGSGKTTIVKAVYDRISANFDVRCFIENIHEYKNSGLNWKVDLQQKVISRLTGTYKIYNDDGPAKIRKFITTQKVLLVLDDVDEFEQLQALGIHLSSSFGCESRIILTTRNKQSLSNLPYTPYEISLLNDMESYELFTLITYGKNEPVDKKFVYEIVHSAAGLPLVLEVWGRHFKTQDRKRWPSLLETLKRIPHEDIQKKLQISYNSLTKRAKKLFLDIACLFYKMKKDLVVKVLQDEDAAFFPDNEIQYLIDKGLVKIEHNNLLMHRAIREMGKEVVRAENEDEPGQRTRLMDHRDVVSVLRDCSGTKSVEGIQLKSYNMKELVTVQIGALKKMSNLRFFQFLGCDPRVQWCSSSNDELSSFSFKKLRFLEWEWFPFKCIDNIDMGNVVVIKLHRSNLEILWEGFKSLKKLRILSVHHSRSLTKTGNFFGLEKLEELCFSYCENLEELHSSIGCLEKLVELDLSHCRKLKRFQWEMIGKLTSLEQLNLNMCSNISNTLCEVGSLPDSLCQLRELTKIVLSGCTNLKSIPNLPRNIKAIIADDCTSLVKLPSNMTELQSLATLVLDDCFNLEPGSFLEVTGLRNLHKLYMRNCSVSQVSNEITNLVSLCKLDLSKNTFSSLPDAFINLSKLEHLQINDCTQLKSIPNLPPNTKYIEARDCISLVNLPSNMSELKFLEELCLDSCFMLEPTAFMKVTRLRNLHQLRMKNCNVSQVSKDIGNLVSLESLDLSENAFISLPDSFVNLFQLSKLTLNDCSQLELLPLLPSNLIEIEACRCRSLDVISYDYMQSAYIFRSKIFKESFFTKNKPLWISLQGEDRVPEWCSYRNKGDILSLVAPMNLDNKICGVILCATLPTEFDDDSEQSLSPRMLNKTKETSHCFYSPDYNKHSICMMFSPLNDKTLVVEAGDTIHVQFKTEFGREAPSCGLCLIYEGEVGDSGLLIRNLIPSEMMTATSSTQFNDDICKPLALE